MPRTKDNVSDATAKRAPSYDPASVQVSVLNLNPISGSHIQNQDHIALVDHTIGEKRRNNERDAIGETTSYNNPLDCFSKVSAFPNFKSQAVN